MAMRRKQQHLDPNIRGGVIEVDMTSSIPKNDEPNQQYSTTFKDMTNSSGNSNNNEIMNLSNPPVVGSSSSKNDSSAVIMTDADAAAGGTTGSTSRTYYSGYNDEYRHHGGRKILDLPSPPVSRGNMSVSTANTDLEFFEDLVSDPVLVFGIDISHLSRKAQFLLCASGVFGFSLFYGILQELLSVQLCNRQLGLFLATAQFTGYTILSFIMRTYVYEREKRRGRHGGRGGMYNKKKSDVTSDSSGSSLLLPMLGGGGGPSSSTASTSSGLHVPFRLYLGLSLLRAVDLGMTNLAMQYINYPAKTLMKSSRVVFTMIFGVLITGKKYRPIDYLIVVCMVIGLAIFMHADANSSAVFQPLGVIMLTVSLICDGAITNMSESIMNQFGVGQDEFIFRMYSISLVAITAAAWSKGDLRDGLIWMVSPGTYAEQQSNVPLDERTWSAARKISAMVLFSSMGFFGSSCSAAITKNFGALSMSITSTARKAMTLFLSFFLFDNQCTFEHITGIIVFICALTAKSLKRSGRRSSIAERASRRRKKQHLLRQMPSSDLELASNMDGMENSSDGGHRRPPLHSSSFGSIESADSNQAGFGQATVGSRRRVGSSSASPLPNRQKNKGHSPKVRYHVV